MYNKLLYICGTSFTYGFARCMNSQYEPPYDVIGSKLSLAFMNGIMYGTPVYTPFYMMKLINRIDIKLSGKDPSKYKNDYVDMFSKNYNVFI